MTSNWARENLNKNNTETIAREEHTIGSQVKDKKEVERELDNLDEQLDYLTKNIIALSDRLSPLISQKEIDGCTIATPEEVLCELAKQIKIKRVRIEDNNNKINYLLNNIQL